MRNYKFKHLDLDGENEYKVNFEVSASVSKDETLLELDGEIYIEDHNGDEVDFKSLSKLDQESLIEAVDSWLEVELMENAYNYQQDAMDGLSDYFYDGDR
jgi:hypothetical protein